MYFIEHDSPYEIDPELNQKNEELIKLNAKINIQKKKKGSLVKLIDAMSL